MVFSPGDGPALLSGVLVGFVLGLIGGGGSVFATPLLVYFVGLRDPHIAIGTGATAVAINALVNLAGHARAGNVRWPCALFFAAAGSLGAVLGSSLGKVFDGQKLLLLFGVLMLVIAAQMGLKKPADSNDEVRMTTANALRMAPSLAFFGLGAGALADSSALAAGFWWCRRSSPRRKCRSFMPSAPAGVGHGIWRGHGGQLRFFRPGGLAHRWFPAGGRRHRRPRRRAAGRATGRAEKALTQVFAALVAGVGLYVIYRGALALFAA